MRAKLVRMKVHVFSGATQFEDVWNEHGCATKLNSAAREVQFMCHVPPGASALNIKKHIQTNLKGRNPESYEDWITCMSMSNDLEWTKQGKTETCLHNARKKWQHLRHHSNSNQDTGAGASWGPRQTIRCGTEYPTDNGTLSNCRWLTYSSVTLDIQ